MYQILDVVDLSHAVLCGYMLANEVKNSTTFKHVAGVAKVAPFFEIDFPRKLARNDAVEGRGKLTAKALK